MEDATHAHQPKLSTQSLREALRTLRANPHPHLANPPGCKKRASVALVIRIRPPHGQTSVFEPRKYSPNVPVDQQLDNFFDQTWVQHGTPEILFIKRAARASDRWGGHIAFPGGVREQSDTDDYAVSTRETEEETGLSLANSNSINIGNLPERLVTAAWGKRPLMVLCPFVFLNIRYDTPPLDPQPSEVESIHWVPLYSILDPNLRSRQSAEISDRVVPLQMPSVKSLLQALGGTLVFGAVRLKPSESKFSILWSTTGSDETNKAATNKSVCNVRAFQQPLLLWGLTLGMLADFLDILDAPMTSKLWKWPTFQHWDLRFVCWLFTRTLRNTRTRRLATLSNNVGRGQGVASIDASSYTIRGPSGRIDDRANIAAGHLLDDYFEQMKRALTVAVGIRLSVSVIAMAIAVQRFLR